jgi:hypothetical protein
MPRDLTDLMERATSFAPPEPYDAADITRLAAGHLRRRRSTIAGGVALAVVVAGVAGYGVTRSGDTTPEPAVKLRYGQQLKLTDAVPATSMSGFRELHYAIKPVDQQPQTRRQFERGLPSPAYAEYRGLDADGRVIVVRRAVGERSPIRSDVLAGPESSSSMATSPPPPARNGTHPNYWIPRFTGDGRLLWTPYLPVVGSGQVGARITDLAGSDDRSLVFDHSLASPPSGGSNAWVSGDRLWFTYPQFSFTHLKAAPTVALHSVPLDDPGRLSTTVQHVVGAAVSDGTMGWVTREGRGYLGPAGGRISSFALPLDPGCTVYPWANQVGQFAVAQGLLAFAEACGAAHARTFQPVVVDGAGRLVLHVSTPSSGDYSLSGASFAFLGFDGASGRRAATYRVDLRDGALALLGGERSSSGSPEVAGRYILWHDSDSYHVGEFGP